MSFVSPLKMDPNRNRSTNVKGAAFHKQAKDNLQSILENFLAIINLMKVEDTPPNQIKDQLPRLLTNTTDDFEMRVRAYNMVSVFIHLDVHLESLGFRFVPLNRCWNSSRIWKIKQCSTIFGQSMMQSKHNGNDSKINNQTWIRNWSVYAID